MHKPSEIEMIIFNGYYLKDESGVEPLPHTQETRELYERGWKQIEPKIDLEKESDLYEGVIYIDEKPFAQFILQDSDKEVEYEEII